MIIKCGLCGQNIEVPQQPEDGQHILCPYCGGKSAYSKPARIQLPLGAAQAPRAAARPKSSPPPTVEPSSAPTPMPEPEPPPAPVKPKIGLYRPDNLPSSSYHPVENDLVSRVTNHADEEFNRKKARQSKKELNIILILIALVGVILIAGYIFIRLGCRRDPVTHLPPPATPPAPIMEEHNLPPDEPKPTPPETKPTPTPKPVEKPIATWVDITMRLQGVQVSYWSKLDNASRPGKTDGEFLFISSRTRKDAIGYVLLSSPTGVLSIVKYEGSRKPIATTYDDYMRQLLSKGGFVVKDRVAYYVSPSDARKQWQAPVGADKVFNPAENFFGNSYRMVTEYGMDGQKLRFAVLFAPDDYTEPIQVGEVAFGQAIPAAAFWKVAEDIAQDRQQEKPHRTTNPKKIKRTVVFYDGRLIARGMDGITKVPRKWPNANGQEYLKWLALRDEALRQEAEVQRIEGESRQAAKEWRKKSREPITESTVKRILYAGSVSIKRK